MGILRTDKISGLETPTAVTGSVVFDGTGDYLQITPDEDFAFGNSDFTIETWAYFDTVSSGSGQIYEGRPSGTQGAYVSLYFSADNTFTFYTDSSERISVEGIVASRWYHIALVRNSGTTTLYFDGVSQGTYSDSQSYLVRSDGPLIGIARNESNNPLDGYLSNYRILKGTALYTSNFTPPTHALEVIGDTVLLCCNNSDSAGADGTGKTVTANGNAAASTFSPGLTRDFTSGTEFRGVTTFDTQGYFVPPSGTTEQRGRGRGLSGGGSQPGNTNAIEYFTISSMGNAFDFGDLTESRRGVGACASSTRGIFAGGGGSPNPAFTNTIEFVTISTEGNSVSFGDLDDERRNIEGLSSQTRGVWAGGSKPAIDNVIQFITIETLGDATNFGDLQAGQARVFLATAESTTRGLFAGGYGGPSPLNGVNTIGYITIASTGDAQNFGDLFTGAYSNAGTSSNTRAVFAGGADGPAAGDMQNVIEYVTIATLGNAQDFGDLTGANENIRGTSNKVRGVFAGGYQPGFTNTMQYITISSTGNALDFGDLVSAISQQGMCSDSHGGIS